MSINGHLDITSITRADQSEFVGSWRAKSPLIVTYLVKGPATFADRQEG
jgi:hypothetical protein